MSKNFFLLSCIFGFSILFPAISFSQTGVLAAKIIRIDITPKDSNGGCVALLNKKVSMANNVVLNCPGSWVSFSCNGYFNSKDFAYQKLDFAREAKAGGYTVVLHVNDAKKVSGGVCFVERIGLTNTK